MSYNSNYKLNQRISYLENIIQQLIPILPIDLTNVLLQGNSAGASNIDLNNNNILQVNNLDVVTINNAAYPPPGPSLNVASTNTNASFFPVFVEGNGAQILRCNNSLTPFLINPLLGTISLVNTFRIDGRTAGGGQVRLGVDAGITSPGVNSVAIGDEAGQTTIGASAVSIGLRAGQTTQANNSVAIGENAGQTTQGGQSVAIGLNAGQTTQGSLAVAIGSQAGNASQGANAIAIGFQAGQGTISGQGANAIAIGNNAGVASQTAGSICLNASGVAVNPNDVGLFIDPIRAGALGSSFTPALPPTALYYDNATFEFLRAT
jgi:hypothetical protein